MLLQNLYWTRIINLIIHKYLAETTICILWHKEIDFQLEEIKNASSLQYSSFLIIERRQLGQTFEQDVIDYRPKEQQLKDNSIIFDNFILRLTLAIEKSHCTSFFAFEEDIPPFIEAFKNASRYSVWRSTSNKFIFGFRNESIKNWLEKSVYFQHDFFDEQSRILVIESCFENSSVFNLKTNRFVGPKDENRRSLYLLDTFDAEQKKLLHGKHLFPNKISNLYGRELIVAALNYAPTVVLNYGPQYHTRDLAFEDLEQSMVKIDGTEMRTMIVFCELYNCTLQINTADTDDWGTVYLNMTGDSTLGMIAKGTVDIAMGAMYSWIDIYKVIDMSVYISRHGVTCVVPKPNRLTSWVLPLEPFQALLWAAVVMYLIIEVIALFVAHRMESILGAERKFWTKSFIFAFVTTLKIFISQSNSDYISSMTMRVMLFYCFLNDIIVTSIYGGGLASILTVPSLEEAADSVERLRTHKLKWVGDSDAWINGLENVDDQKLLEIVKHFRSYTLDELRTMTLTDKIGFAIERLPFGHFALEGYFTEEALKHMKVMMDDIYYQYTVIFTARLWPLLESYNCLLYMWHSSGFDKYWEWRVVTENMNSQLQKMVEASMHNLNEDLGPVSLDMSNFAGMLIIWVLGISIAILAFVAEFIYKHLRPSK